MKLLSNPKRKAYKYKKLLIMYGCMHKLAPTLLKDGPLNLCDLQWKVDGERRRSLGLLQAKWKLDGKIRTLGWER